MVDLLERAGHEVYSAGVSSSPVYPASRYFVKFPGNQALSTVAPHLSLMEDWAIGRLFSTNDVYFDALAKIIPVKPDVLFCEQPWMFAFAQRYNNRVCKGQARLVYGSQNIEHQLKYGMAAYHFGEKIARDCREKVRDCEIEAIKGVVQTFCVSDGDLAWTASYTDRHPILAPNGVIDRVAGMTDIEQANRFTEGRKFALYCASAHPPNMDGFFEMFGYGVGCFPPDSRMVVAGGAGHHILHDPKYSQVGGMHKIYVNAGEVSESVLRGLLATAHQIVLPITHGGGTNLKSAEAIWAGCHIVATTKAMRGFEEFSHAKGITVADDPASFCAAIRDGFLRPKITLTRDEREARRGVLWEEVLADLVRNIGELEAA
ncbi:MULTISPECIES: glycosyltransferase [Sphingobium]|uniref:glycosyltransferase n=1 Tax=Sphingobium TaxID=165695 RepID=UPI0011D1328A|nr:MULTISPECIES: glycosyltransferase [Sphingobium]WDA38701.1 glycosyltransferase [Sphingobium sp. YC-XJ3]